MGIEWKRGSEENRESHQKLLSARVRTFVLVVGIRSIHTRRKASAELALQRI